MTPTVLDTYVILLVVYDERTYPLDGYMLSRPKL